MTILQFRRNQAEKIKNSATPQLDADLILADFTQKDKTYFLLHSTDEISSILNESDISNFEKLIEKRVAGLPVSYITHKKDFYGLEFYVDQNVLIPKPDTEILVEKAIQLINENNLLDVADICTGSGCIAISIAKNVQQNVKITASDISEDALNVAKKNAQNLNVKNISFALGNTLENFQAEEFDIIVTNPPYVPHTLTEELLKDGRSEPRLALDGDAMYKSVDNSLNDGAVAVEQNDGADDTSLDDGLSVIRKIIPESFQKLKPNGYFLCETGEYNSEKTCELCKKIGFSSIIVLNDLEGMPRVVMAQKL